MFALVFYFICKLVLWFTMPPIKAVMHDCFFDSFLFLYIKPRADFTLRISIHQICIHKHYWIQLVRRFSSMICKFFSLLLSFKYPYTFLWAKYTLYLRIVLLLLFSLFLFELLNLHLLIGEKEMRLRNLKFKMIDAILLCCSVTLPSLNLFSPNIFKKNIQNVISREKLFRFLFVHFNRLSINCDICMFTYFIQLSQWFIIYNDGMESFPFWFSWDFIQKCSFFFAI